MSINISVTGSRLKLLNDAHLYSGTQNAATVKFYFETEDWDDYSITAVFTRKEYKRYVVDIKPSVEVSIPAEVLQYAGIAYISLLGTKGDDTVLTTNSVPLTVEYSGLDIMRSTPYPEPDRENTGSDPYAAYVNIVSEALDKANDLTKELETKLAEYDNDSVDTKLKEFQAVMNFAYDAINSTVADMKSTIDSFSARLNVIANVVSSIEDVASFNDIEVTEEDWIEVDNEEDETVAYRISIEAEKGMLPEGIYEYLDVYGDGTFKSPTKLLGYKYNEDLNTYSVYCDKAITGIVRFMHGCYKVHKEG